MKRRGYIVNWRNRYWGSITTALGQGTADPKVPEESKGDMPNFWVLNYKGLGYNYYDEDDEKIRFLSDVTFVSTVFKHRDGTLYRFVMNYHRQLPDSELQVSFGLVDCSETGKFAYAVTTYESMWRAEVGDRNRAYSAYELWHGTADNSLWLTVNSEKPFISQDTYNAMMSAPDRIRDAAKNAAWTGTFKTSTFAFRTGIQIWKESAFYWQTPTTTQNEIVSRARSLSNYKYWYGGAGQIATKELADSLRNSYPGVWTPSYYKKALNDIGQRIGDCSYLVNYAYGIASPGNHGIGTSQYLAKYSKWKEAPKDGMIAWRSGHTGIYAEGKTIELVGIDYDYMEKPYDASKWSAILYDPNRTY